MPSGNKIYADIYGAFMNIRVSVVGRPSIEGMLGSPDGNSNNDFRILGTSRAAIPPQGGVSSNEHMDSWR